eukprot:750391-Hanusia_phi.AAC.6
MHVIDKTVSSKENAQSRQSIINKAPQNYTTQFRAWVHGSCFGTAPQKEFIVQNETIPYCIISSQTCIITIESPPLLLRIRLPVMAGPKANFLETTEGQHGNETMVETRTISLNMHLNL